MIGATLSMEDAVEEQRRRFSEMDRRLGVHVRALKLERGLTSEQVADAMREAGHSLWTAKTLTDVMHNRALKASEVPDLAKILHVTVTVLLAPPADLAIGPLPRGRSKKPTGDGVDLRYLVRPSPPAS